MRPWLVVEVLLTWTFASSSPALMKTLCDLPLRMTPLMTLTRDSVPLLSMTFALV